MMRTFNRTLLGLRVNEETDELGDYERTLKMKAFNLTLIENSKHFLRMLTVLRDEEDEKAEESEVSETAEENVQTADDTNNNNNNNNNNNDDDEKTGELVARLKTVFIEKNLDKNVIYKKFVNQFSSKFDEQVLSSAAADWWSSALSGLFKNLNSNLARFQRRYKVINYSNFVIFH
jgi:isocitrate dehydrogenase kinase/phosphatase